MDTVIVFNHLYTSFMLYDLLDYTFKAVDKQNKIHLMVKTYYTSGV